MSIHIWTYAQKYQTQLCISRKLRKSFFVNNFYVPELYTLTFLTQKETMVTQISASSPSPNFHSGEIYVKKITVYFLAIKPTSHVKLRSLN